MFETIHDSAPKIANQNKANPSGLLHGAIMMLAGNALHSTVKPVLRL